MAYAVDPMAQQKRAQEAAMENGTATGAGGATSNGAAGSGSGTVTGMPATTPTPGSPAAANAGSDANAGTTGTGYVNLSQYVANNQDAAGAMAGKLSDSAQAQGSKAQGEMGDLANQYQNQVAANTYSFAAPAAQGAAFPQTPAVSTSNLAAGAQQANARTSIASPISATAGNAAPAAGAPVNAASMIGGIPRPAASAPVASPLQPALTNAQNWIAQTAGKQTQGQEDAAAAGITKAADPAAYAAAQATAGQSYAGPNSLADLSGYGQTASDAQAAVSAAQGLQNPYSVGSELGTAYGNGYGGGAGGANENLDSFLTQQKGQAQFDQLTQQYGGLSNQLAAGVADTTQADAAKGQDALASAAAGQFVAGQDANTAAAKAYQGVLDQRAASTKQAQSDDAAYKQYQDYWQSYHKNFFHPLGSPFTPNSNKEFGSQGMNFQDWMKWRNSGAAPSDLSTLNRNNGTGQ